MSAPNFFQSTVRARTALGFYGDGTGSTRTLANVSGQAADVWTVAVPASPDNSTAYSVTVNGTTASYTTDGSATQAELGAGLVAAIDASVMNGLLTPSYAGGTLTLTGNFPGIDFTPTVSGGSGASALGTPSNSTAAASASTVAFGLLMCSDGQVTDERILKGFVPTTSLMTAQVQSHTFAGNTGAYYSGTVSINGKAYNWGGVVWTSDLDTTCGLIATAINAVMPTETVLAASVGSGGGVVTLTAEVEGAEFDSTAVASGHADAEATKAYTTGPSRATSLARAFAGVSRRRLDVENLTLDGDDPAYAANAGVEAFYSGFVLVETHSETPTPGDDVYVSVASATKGEFYTSAGTDRVWMPRDLLTWDTNEDSGTSDSIGRIRIHRTAL